MGKISKEEKKASIILALLMAAILTSPFHGIDGMIILIVATMLLFFPGINVGITEDTKSVSIGMIMFIGSCMAIGSGCTALGITEILSTSLAPMLSQLSPFWLLLGILLFGVIMNVPMTPLAMLAALPAPLYAIGTAAGVNPFAIAFTFLFSTDMVFLPFQYVVFLIFFSFGTMTTGQFAKYHALKDIMFTIFFIAIIVPWWHLLGIF